MAKEAGSLRAAMYYQLHERRNLSFQTPAAFDRGATTCDPEPVDEDAACSTEKTAQGLGGGAFQTGFVGATSVAPDNQSMSAGYAPIPKTLFTFVKR